jgi:hypothetical protein
MPNMREQIDRAMDAVNAAEYDWRTRYTIEYGAKIGTMRHEALVAARELLASLLAIAVEQGDLTSAHAAAAMVAA